MKYIIEYGSNSQRTSTVESDSRDAKKWGRQALGSAGGGFVCIYRRLVDGSKGQQVSYARYSPDGKGSWYSAQM